MRRPNVLIGALATMSAVALLASPALADGTLEEARDSTSASADGGTLEAIALTDGAGRPWDSGPVCTWAGVDATGTAVSAEYLSEAISSYDDGVASILYRRDCDDGTSATIWVPQLTAQDLVGPLLDHVTGRLHFPEAVYEPIDKDYGWTYVQVPVDFRTTPETWKPIVVTAAVNGPPATSSWVTITAVPTELWFASGDPNDPGPVAGCRGPAAVAPYVAATPGACSYTFTNASTIMGDGVFPAEVGIVWDVTYESSDGPGVLSVDPTISPAPIRVSEIKALVVCTGPDPLQGGCATR